MSNQSTLRAMKKIEVKVYTRQDLMTSVNELQEKVSSLEGKNLNDFGKFCLANAKELLEKYSKLLDSYSWKDVFFMVDGRPVTILFDESYSDAK